MTVLIISALQDTHAVAVIEALAARGNCTAELLDLSEFPDRLALTIAFEEGLRRFALRRRGGGLLDLSGVNAVWWRRPQPFGLSAAITDASHRRFVLSESLTAFQGLYRALGAFWVNEPGRDADAGHKPWQLALAQEIGLDIPPTAMTNDPEEVREFRQRHKGRIIYKQFLALPDAWRETRLLKPEEAEQFDAVRLAPVIFQQYVEAVADIRVIAIGEAFYAASTDLRKVDYPVDIRLNLEARYEAYRLPAAVEDRLHALMGRLGLEYGAVDLRLTPDGNHVFLEINPSGQFLYIEQMTGQPIAAALAAHLVTQGQRHRSARNHDSLLGQIG